MDDEKMIYKEGDKVSEKKETCRIIITGGGTGGHIFPALAIADSLKSDRPGTEILFVGASGKMEMEKIPEAGYKIIGLDIAGYNRSSLIRNISLPYKLVKSFFQARQILNTFKPDAAIGVGGYSTFPVLRLAQARNIPTFILESNSLPGKSNRMLAKKATKIFVASGGMEKYFPPEKIMVTGNPVRDVFSKKISKEVALAFFGLKEGVKTVFVMGGSLGAKSINETIDENIGVFKKNNLQLIWQTGKTYAGEAARAEEERTNIWTNAFINKMEYAYAAADVVVARAGAMTIAEISMVKKASVLVPYPFSAENHQVANAQNLVNRNAALMVADAEVKTKLLPALLGLLKNEKLIEEMENNISQVSKANAGETIAGEIEKILNKA